MNIVKGDLGEVYQKAVAQLSKLFEENKDKSILFLTSGGSAMTLLDALPFPNVQKITLGVLDERFTFKEVESNFYAFSQTSFYKEGIEKGAKIIDPRPEDGEELEDAATEFAQALNVWRVQNPDGVIIATIGVGDDGHTAGVFPFPNDQEDFNLAFNTPNNFVFGYEIPKEVNFFTQRMTATLSFLRDEVAHAVCFLHGEGKTEALKDIEDEKGYLHVTPARILHEMKNVTVFAADV